MCEFFLRCSFFLRNMHQNKTSFLNEMYNCSCELGMLNTVQIDASVDDTQSATELSDATLHQKQQLQVL